MKWGWVSRGDICQLMKEEKRLKRKIVEEGCGEKNLKKGADLRLYTRTQ
jgi:hypothetical protein